MKRRTAVLAIAFIFAPSVVAQDGAALVGRWRSVETSQGGIGAMYDFTADGKFRFSPGAIVDMPYRLEGDQLILPPAATNEAEQKSTIVWTGTDLFRMSLAGKEGPTYHRQGAQMDDRNPLAGEWFGSQQMEGKTLETRFIFDASGSCLMLIRFSTQEGSYSVVNGKLLARINGAIALDGAFTIANGVLAIHRASEKVTRLKRY